MAVVVAQFQNRRKKRFNTADTESTEALSFSVLSVVIPFQTDPALNEIVPPGGDVLF